MHVPGLLNYCLCGVGRRYRRELIVLPLPFVRKMSSSLQCLEDDKKALRNEELMIDNLYLEYYEVHSRLLTCASAKLAERPQSNPGALVLHQNHIGQSGRMMRRP